MCRNGPGETACKMLPVPSFPKAHEMCRNHNLLAQAQFGKLQSEGGFLDAAFEAALQGATVYAKDGKSLALRAG